VVIRRTLAAFATLAAVVAGPPILHAAPAPAATHVVWSRDARAYLAPADSGALAIGDRVWFVSSGDVIASGTVARVDAGGLALALLDSGSLDGAKRLDRVEVNVTRPPPRTPASLTIGCASPRRPMALLAPLKPISIGRARVPAGYRLDTLATNGFRLVRDSLVSAPGRPDTLVVRWFDVVVDEEIALERGELDVAVFQPGELSAHVRDAPRWRGFAMGERSHAALAWIAVDPNAVLILPRMPTRSASGASAAGHCVLLNGDCGPWPPAESLFTRHDGLPPPGGAPLFWSEPVSPPDRGGDARVEARRNRGSALRALLLDTDVHSVDSLALALANAVRGQPYAIEMRARADSLERAIRERAPETSVHAAWDVFACLHNSFGLEEVLTLRCPVVCSSELRPYVDAVGAGAFADLMGAWGSQGSSTGGKP
jgi:hypothetical protein